MAATRIAPSRAMDATAVAVVVAGSSIQSGYLSRNSLHWENPWGWLRTMRMVSRLASSQAIRQCTTRSLSSPTMATSG